jgi:hypothetical protein
VREVSMKTADLSAVRRLSEGIGAMPRRTKGVGQEQYYCTSLGSPRLPEHACRDTAQACHRLFTARCPLFVYTSKSSQRTVNRPGRSLGLQDLPARARSCWYGSPDSWCLLHCSTRPVLRPSVQYRRNEPTYMYAPTTTAYHRSTIHQRTATATGGIIQVLCCVHLPIPDFPSVVPNSLTPTLPGSDLLHTDPSACRLLSGHFSGTQHARSMPGT